MHARQRCSNEEEVVVVVVVEEEEGGEGREGVEGDGCDEGLWSIYRAKTTTKNARDDGGGERGSDHYFVRIGVGRRSRKAIQSLASFRFSAFFLLRSSHVKCSFFLSQNPDAYSRKLTA